METFQIFYLKNNKEFTLLLYLRHTHFNWKAFIYVHAFGWDEFIVKSIIAIIS